MPATCLCDSLVYPTFLTSSWSPNTGTNTENLASSSLIIWMGNSSLNSWKQLPTLATIKWSTGKQRCRLDRLLFPARPHVFNCSTAINARHPTLSSEKISQHSNSLWHDIPLLLFSFPVKLFVLLQVGGTWRKSSRQIRPCAISSQVAGKSAGEMMKKRDAIRPIISPSFPLSCKEQDEGAVSESFSSLSFWFNRANQVIAVNKWHCSPMFTCRSRQWMRRQAESPSVLIYLEMHCTSEQQERERGREGERWSGRKLLSGERVFYWWGESSVLSMKLKRVK